MHESHFLQILTIETHHLNEITGKAPGQQKFNEKSEFTTMNDRIKQAIFEELSVLLREPGQETEERLKKLKFTEGKHDNIFAIT